MQASHTLERSVQANVTPTRDPASTIDRLGPALRPLTHSLGRQDWRHLCFLHWPAAPEAVRPLLPPGLELDLHRGRAWLSVVPFECRRTRVAALPRVKLHDFLEVTVRTYVLRDGVPGVFYFSLDANSRLAVWAARSLGGLAFRRAKIAMAVEGHHVSIQAKRLTGTRPILRARLTLGTSQALSAPGTVEHFLLERYAWYVRRLGQVWRGRIHHAPLLWRPAHLLEIDDELVHSAGLPGYAFPPPLAHYVAGADVELFAPTRCGR